MTDKLYNKGSMPVKFIKLNRYKERGSVRINASDIKEVRNKKVTTVILVDGTKIRVHNGMNSVQKKMEKALSNPRSRAEVS